MTPQKGWINRQFARVEREAQSWPSWMRHEPEARPAPAQEIARSVGACEAPEEAMRSSEEHISVTGKRR